MVPDSDTYVRICELYGWPDAPRIGGFSSGPASEVIDVLPLIGRLAQRANATWLVEPDHPFLWKMR